MRERLWRSLQTGKGDYFKEIFSNDGTDSIFRSVCGGYGAEFGLMVCITDRDQVVAVAGGPKKELLSKTISRELERVIMERETVQAAAGDKRFLYLVPDEVEGLCAEVIVPIICEGDAIGSVALFSRDQRTKMGDTELKLAQTAAGFLGVRWKAESTFRKRPKTGNKSPKKARKTWKYLDKQGQKRYK